MLCCVIANDIYIELECRDGFRRVVVDETYQYCQGLMSSASHVFQVSLYYYSIFVIDVDECNERVAECHPNATCINTPGTFMCLCDHGYEGDGLTCSGE